MEPSPNELTAESVSNGLKFHLDGLKSFAAGAGCYIKGLLVSRTHAYSLEEQPQSSSTGRNPKCKLKSHIL